MVNNLQSDIAKHDIKKSTPQPEPSASADTTTTKESENKTKLVDGYTEEELKKLIFFNAKTLKDIAKAYGFDETIVLQKKIDQKVKKLKEEIEKTKVPQKHLCRKLSKK